MRLPSPPATDLTNPDLAGLISLLPFSVMARMVSIGALCEAPFPAFSVLSGYKGDHPGHAFLCGVNMADLAQLLLLSDGLNRTPNNSLPFLARMRRPLRGIQTRVLLHSRTRNRRNSKEHSSARCQLGFLHQTGFRGHCIRVSLIRFGTHQRSLGFKEQEERSREILVRHSQETEETEEEEEEEEERRRTKKEEEGKTFIRLNFLLFIYLSYFLVKFYYIY
jgi:hypothetical protein